MSSVPSSFAPNVSNQLSPTVPVSETDYLDEDKPIRNQNFVCLSFISPEDVLLSKEVHFFNKYISSFSKELAALLDGIETQYPDSVSATRVLRENNAYMFEASELQEQFKFFKAINCDKLEREYAESIGHKTSIRGIKVRGTYDTLKEAQTRAEVLKKMGDKFDIFVAQVGCWCPWSPNPDEMEDQKYSEEMLNTIVGKYKENQQQRDEFYAERKEFKISEAKREADKIRTNNLLSEEAADPAKGLVELLEDASAPVGTSSGSAAPEAAPEAVE